PRKAVDQALGELRCFGVRRRQLPVRLDVFRGAARRLLAVLKLESLERLAELSDGFRYENLRNQEKHPPDISPLTCELARWGHERPSGAKRGRTDGDPRAA